MRNCYEVLGMSEGDSLENYKSKYEQLKAKYSEDRFLSGEAGNEGAKNLTELEVAWSQIESTFAKKESAQTFGSDLGSIDDMIKRGKYDEAQAALDAYGERTAEWYYLQSIIYYKREWLSDSRKQLAIAVSMEPSNEKYKTALEKLDMVIGNPNADATTLGADPSGVPPFQGQPQGQQQGQMCGGNMLSNCCLAYCCTDCCCSMTRCCG